MAKFYRVNMNTLAINALDVPAQYAGLGGRGLTSKVIKEEVPPLCHPLGPNNKLVFAAGLLSGTGAVNAGRMSVGGKSPLTGGIKESNIGGNIGHKLGRLNVNAIIVEGQAPRGKSYVLKVHKDGAALLPADSLKGAKIYDTVAALHKDHGDKVGILAIGPAGEMLMPMACIGGTDMEGVPTRQAGRGGLGAVMGSKGLKAVVVDDTGAPGVTFADEAAFRAANKKLVDALMQHAVTSQTLPSYGTDALVNVMSEAGGLPTRNFSSGRFEQANDIGGETLAATCKERGGKTGHACSPGCIIRCSNIYKNKAGTEITGGFEYESIWALGANCGINDLDAIAQLNRLCDDYGIDTIEAGVTLAVIMEAGVIPFGDAQGAIRLVNEIGQGTPLGRILGAGAETTGKAFGITRVPTVKGQGIPAYDPRAVKGMGVTYATTTMGADHTAGYAVAPNILGVGGKLDPLSPEGQVDVSRNLQIATAALDSTGLCLFVAFAILDIPSGFEGIVEMLNARHGLKLTGDDVTALGKEILKTERAFNIAAGITAAKDDLPEYMRLEKLPPHNTVFDVPKAELDKVFNF